MRRWECYSVLRHAYFSNIVTAAAVVINRRNLKIAKNDNNVYANALLCYVSRTLLLFCKVLNSFKFNNTFCQSIRLLSSFET